MLGPHPCGADERQAVRREGASTAPGLGLVPGAGLAHTRDHMLHEIPEALLQGWTRGRRRARHWTQLAIAREADLTSREERVSSVAPTALNSPSYLLPPREFIVPVPFMVPFRTSQRSCGASLRGLE